jgi:hypothetical protein
MAHDGNLNYKYSANLPWNFNPMKCRYCSKLQWYFCNIVRQIKWKVIHPENFPLLNPRGKIQMMNGSDQQSFITI